MATDKEKIIYEVDVDASGAESSLDGLESSMGSASGAAGGLVGSIKSVGLALKALATNPIVLTLTAIVAGFGLMVKAMKSSEDGTAALNKIMAVFNQIFNSVLTAVEKIALPLFTALGDLLTDYIIPAFKSLTVFADAFGKAVDVVTGYIKLALTPLKALWAGAQAAALVIQGDFAGAKQVMVDFKNETIETAIKLKDDFISAVNLTVEAVGDLGESFDKAKESGDDLFSLAAQIEDRQNQLNKDKREQLLLDAQLATQANEARARVKDDTTSVEERMKALDEFRAIEKQRAEEAIKIQEQEIQLQKDKMALAPNSQADEDALNQLLIAREQTNAVLANQEKKYFTEKKTLRAEEEADKKRIESEEAKRIDAARKAELKADKDFKKAQIKADQELARLQDDLTKQGFALIGQLAGEESILGKAGVIAEIGLDTFKGANKALASSPPPSPLGAIGAGIVIASGLASAVKASGIQLPKRKGASGSGSVSVPSISAPSIPSFSENLTDDISTDETAAALNAQSRQPLEAVVVLSSLEEAQGVSKSLEENASL